MQAWDHCWMQAGGRYWRIVSMRGLGDIIVQAFDGELAKLDLSGVDWPAYCAKAVELMRGVYEL